jgi:nitrite reductase/ring-hydroxylating ferredoxin subunit
MKSFAVLFALFASASAFAPSTRLVRPSTTLAAAKGGTALKYVDAIDAADLPKPGNAVGAIAGGLDVCIAVATDGLIYAIGNKAPPTATPFAGCKVDKTTIKDSQYGTDFSLTTGEPVGKWCPSGIGFLVGKLVGPTGVPTYKVSGGGNSFISSLVVSSVMIH